MLRCYSSCQRRWDSNSEIVLYDRFYGCSSSSSNYHISRMVYGSKMFVPIMIADLQLLESIYMWAEETKGGFVDPCCHTGDLLSAPEFEDYGRGQVN